MQSCHGETGALMLNVNVNVYRWLSKLAITKENESSV